MDSAGQTLTMHMLGVFFLFVFFNILLFAIVFKQFGYKSCRPDIFMGLDMSTNCLQMLQAVSELHVRMHCSYPVVLGFWPDSSPEHSMLAETCILKSFKG